MHQSAENMSGNTAELIATTLKETEEGPRELIERIVETLGEDLARELLQETEKIEASGGEMIRRGTRRRTAGGVFFRLARHRLTEEQRRELFGRAAQPKVAAGDAAAPPAAPEAAPEAAPAPAPQPAPSARSVPQRVAPPQPVYRAKPRYESAETPVMIRKRRVVDVMGLRNNAVRDSGPRASVPGVSARPPVAEPAREPARPTAVAPERAPLAPPRPERRSDRVRIIQLAPQPKEPPATTPEEIQKRIEELLAKLGPAEAQRIVLELLAGAFKGAASDDAALRGVIETALDARWPKLEPPPESREEPIDEGPPEPSPELRERVLAAVTDALALTSADYARVVLGDDTPAAKRKATAMLKRYRGA